MKTVTLNPKKGPRRAAEALKGRVQGAHISFATPELLFSLLTTKRWEILRMMTYEGGA